MKKMLRANIAFLLIFLLQACTTIPPNARPTYYDKTKWVAQELNMYFEVDDKYIPLTYTNTYGELVQDDVMTPFCVLFDYGTHVVFSEFLPEVPEISSELALFRGSCKFSKDKLVVDVWENDFLDPAVKQITFIREELTGSK